MPLAFCRLEVPRQHRWAFAQYAELCAGFLERPKDEIGAFWLGCDTNLDRFIVRLPLTDNNFKPWTFRGKCHSGP